jgi:hypothetical protein
MKVILVVWALFVYSEDQTIQRIEDYEPVNFEMQYDTMAQCDAALAETMRKLEARPGLRAYALECAPEDQWWSQ